MKRARTPQEKKLLSYEKDHRDSYGESNKGSRKTVPRKKQVSNQRYRHNVNQLVKISAENTEEIENKINDIRNIRWKKSNDQPLGLFLNRKGKLDIGKISKVRFSNGQKPNPNLIKNKTN